MAIALALSAAPSHAQAPAGGSSDSIAARTLFDDARKLAGEGQYEQACPKFEESQRLRPGVGTLFNWADCLEHTGKHASAWAHYLEVAASAKANGQTEREKVARDRAAALEPKLSKLIIEVRANDPDLEVLRDGVRVGRALWGTAVPIDPGAHRIEARAPSKRRWASTVQVAQAGARATVVVPVLEPGTDTAPPIEDAAGSSSAGTGSAAAAGSATGPSSGGALSGLQPGGALADPSSFQASGSMDSAASDMGWRRSQKTIGIVTGSVGLAAAIAGGVLVGIARSKNDSAAAVCQGSEGLCAPAEIDRRNALVDEGKSLQSVGIVVLAVGGAALVGGTALFLTAPQRSSQAATWRVQPSVGPQSAGLWVAGAW